jgi:NADH:ubiquinone oxidoreductase subunit F (NADH-binding)
LPSTPDARRRAALLDAVEASGLCGRGGGGFPTAAKLRAVAEGRRPIVVANGTEGEPASKKDKALLAYNPHLVLDGAVAAAGAVGAKQAIVAIGRDAPAVHARLALAIEERDRVGDAARIRLVSTPDRFVAGQETALVNWLNGSSAKPTVAPPRPSQRGVKGRPTLVQNVETLADIALIARYGADWFRSVGTDAEPGSVLVTLGGAVRHEGVIEVAQGTPVRAVLARCGGASAQPRALLIGGYFGSWLSADDALDIPLSAAALHPLGAALGTRALVVLPEGVCGLTETARVVSYLADESAGQCGPCLFGLRAIADALQAVAARQPDAAAALSRLPRLHAQVAGRGACAHPDGAVRLAQSALSVFADEVEAHLAGRCTATHTQPFLPVPARSSDWR